MEITLIMKLTLKLHSLIPFRAAGEAFLNFIISPHQTKIYLNSRAKTC